MLNAFVTKFKCIKTLNVFKKPNKHKIKFSTFISVQKGDKRDEHYITNTT